VPPDPRLFDGVSADVVRRFTAVVGRATEVTAAATRAEAPADDDDAPPVARLGGFRLLASRGGGGFARVFLAEDEALGRRVALKLLRPEFAADPTARRRFRLEGEILATLEHPGVVPVLATGEDGPWCFLALKWIDGGTLAERAGRVGPIEAARLGAAVARALHAAHERGIVHRDVKPANVLMDGDEPRLADFGLAHRVLGGRLTTSRAAPGTPAYLAPETLEGRPPDPRTDVWGVGVTLFELVAGTPPFGVDGPPAAVAARIAGDDPPALGVARVNRDFEAIVRRCLEKDPGRRFSTAAALADDLERFVAGRPVLSRRSGVVERLRRKVRRRPRTYAAATAVVLVAAAFAIKLGADAARDRALLDADLARVSRMVDEGRTGAARRLFEPVRRRGGDVATAEVGARVEGLAATDALLDALHDLSALRDPRPLQEAADAVAALPARALPQPLATFALAVARAQLGDEAPTSIVLPPGAESVETALFAALTARREGRPVAERLRALESLDPAVAGHRRLRRARARAAEDAGDFALAQALLEGLSEEGVFSAPIACASARVALLRGDLDRAARWLELAPAEPRSILRDSTAVDLLRERGDPTYRSILATVRARWPGDPHFAALEAEALRAEGRAAEAAALFEVARDLAPAGAGVERAWFDLGIIEARADEIEDGRASAEDADRWEAAARAVAASKGAPSLRAQAYVVVARLHRLRGRLDEAYDATGAALAADPRSPRAIETRVESVQKCLAARIDRDLEEGPDAVPADLRSHAAEARAALEDWFARAPGRARPALVYACGVLAAVDPSPAPLRAALLRLRAAGAAADAEHVRALETLLRLREDE
jgi:hypothetical protein